MGVRLYPILKENVTLDQFLNVPEGTEERVKAHEQNYPKDSTDFVAYEEWYAEMDEDMSKLYNFKLFGWGKFYPCSWQMDGQYLMNSGAERDSNKWKDVFLINGGRFDIALEERVNIINGLPNFTDMLDGVAWG